MKSQGIGSVFFALVLGLCVVWVFNTNRSATPANSAPASEQPLRLDSHTFEAIGTSQARIIGTVKNPGSVKYSSVVVRFNVYDSSGAQVGDTLATVSNLEPFRDWRFEAPVPYPSARTCKFQGIDSAY